VIRSCRQDNVLAEVAERQKDTCAASSEDE